MRRQSPEILLVANKAGSEQDDPIGENPIHSIADIHPAQLKFRQLTQLDADEPMVQGV
jgi:hypothetical protein